MLLIGTNRERGFTLVELLVGMAILIVVATIGGDLIFNVIRSYNKANILAEIEQNGNHTMSIMEQQIRNAASVDPFASPSSSITLHTHQEKDITFSQVTVAGSSCNNGAIMRNSGSGDTPITNTNEINGVNVSELTFTSDGGGNMITIKMVLEEACGAPTRREFQVNPVTLTTTVVLRSSYGT